MPSLVIRGQYLESNLRMRHEAQPTEEKKQVQQRKKVGTIGGGCGAVLEGPLTGHAQQQLRWDDSMRLDNAAHTHDYIHTIIHDRTPK